MSTSTHALPSGYAREALDARFDALIACGFNFEAHTSELNKLGPLPILKAKMNPELHMSDELKNTGAGNLFVVFGEHDIKWEFNDDGEIVVEVLGVDVFDPKTGDVRASGKDDIAAQAADRLLPKLVQDVDGNEQDRRGTVSVFNGPDPEVRTFAGTELEIEGIATWIKKAVEEGIAPSEIEVFVRSNDQLARAPQ